ncbi:MAG TPA: hypothetical protein VHS96_11285, partial [Bacteroidia bacterium]|nr:hypothetical protein [Bacteroidia bacterium]
GALILVLNPWTMTFWGHLFHFHGAYLRGFQPHAFAAYCIFDGWLAVTAVWLLLRKKGFGELFRSSASFLGIIGLAVALMMLVLNPIYAGKLQWPRLAFPLLLLYVVTKAFHLAFVVPSDAAWRMRLRPIATAVWALLAILICLEGVFMFVGKSSVNDTTLASKIWFARHWKLTQEEFRESEELESPDPAKSQLLFIGDSFLAGHGIKNPADRFSDRIQASLGANWQVHNHGQNGANTEMQSFQINRHGPAPKLTVLCWYVNDIQDAAEWNGLKTGNGRRNAPFPVSIAHGSYLFNFLFGLFPDRQAGENYLDFLQKAFSDESVMRDYSRGLVNLQSDCTASGSRFAVVLFPMMNLVDGSEFALKPMRDFWQGKNVPCLDLSMVFRPHPAQSLTVNASDSHPSKFAHQLAAEAIDTFLLNRGLLAE